MWKVVKNKNGVQRWQRSKLSKKKLFLQQFPDNVTGKNKPLEKLWEGLAEGEKAILVYKSNHYKHVKLSRTKSLEEFAANPNVKAVLTAGRSFDGYERLYAKALNKTVRHVIQNYKKYFTAWDSGSKIYSF